MDDGPFPTLPAMNAMLRRNTVIRLLLCCALALPLADPGAAQTSHRIAAIVNDSVITRHDLESRVGLVILFAGREDSETVRRRLRGATLRTLVEEQLKLQEAEDKGVSVSRREVDRGIADFERRQNLSDGRLDTLLAQRGVPRGALERQMRAEIAWTRLVQRRFVPRIAITEEEIQEEIERARTRQGQEEYHLEEIVLPVDRPADAARVRAVADRLVEEIRGGAHFTVLARQFSQSASAAVGGDLGWIDRSALGDPFGAVVPGMKRGEVSEPVRTPAGWRILRLIERRAAAEAAGGDAVSLRRIVLPLPPEAGDAEAEEREARARGMLRDAAGCGDLARLVRKAGGRTSELRDVREADLAPTLRALVDGLPPGAASAPARTPQGVTAVMVCARETRQAKPPDREAVTDLLMQQRLALMARRHLRNLRLSAVIDVRG